MNSNHPSIWGRMQRIDRRILYVLLLFVIGVPIFVTIQLPMNINPATRKFHQSVEAIRPDKLAIVSCGWQAASQAECKPQTEALLRHLMSRRKRLVVMTFLPAGSKLSYDIASRIARETGAEYGKDWIHLGYVAQPTLFMKALVRDVPAAMVKDRNGKPVADYAVMQGINTINDVDFISEVTGTPLYEYWIQLVVGSSKSLKYCAALTAVMAPECYPLLDSGQLNGLMEGMKGAAEYEKLTEATGRATSAMGSLSFGHLLIMLLIIVGNVGYLMARRAEREGTR